MRGTIMGVVLVLAMASARSTLAASRPTLAASRATQAASGATQASSAAASEGYRPDCVIVQLEAPIASAADPVLLPDLSGRPELEHVVSALHVLSIGPALPHAAADAEATVAADSGSSARSAKPSGVPTHQRVERARAFLDSPLARTYRVDLPEGSDVPSAVRLLAATPGVVWAEPDYVGQGASTIPNDPFLGSQWGLSQASNHDINAPEAWDLTTGSSAIVIAMLDSGVDLVHEDFAGKLIPGFDFANLDDTPQDDHGHGSNTASIASGTTNNGLGVAGVCWNCKIMPLKILDSSNFGFYSWWSDALVFAANNGAEIASMSVGGSGASSTLASGIQYAYGAGLVIPAAMMNNNNSVPYYPAVYTEAIAVGATDSLDRRAVPFCWGGGSSFGSHIDLCAPGDLIYGAALGGGYGQWCGTSQATPMVSGVAALIESVNPSAGREEIRHLLQSGADDQVGRTTEDTAGFDVYHGWGRLNARRTLEMAMASITLRVIKGATDSIELATPVPGALSYDFIRGNRASLSETSASVGLGTVVCLENDSPDAQTSGPLVDADPPVGTAYFYLARIKTAPGTGSFGGSTQHRDRRPLAGNCPL